LRRGFGLTDGWVANVKVSTVDGFVFGVFGVIGVDAKMLG
jgi:hypothetical protein